MVTFCFGFFFCLLYCCGVCPRTEFSTFIYCFISMRESEITKFLVTISGQIEHVRFPGGVFDNEVYLQYETVWGPDWEVISGLTSGTSQMARSGSDPERIIFNMPIELAFSSTNISGCKFVYTLRSVYKPMDL